MLHVASRPLIPLCKCGELTSSQTRLSILRVQPAVWELTPHRVSAALPLMTGKLPQDGNHDGMKDHKPVEGHVRRDLDALD